MPRPLRGVERLFKNEVLLNVYKYLDDYRIELIERSGSGAAGSDLRLKSA